MSFDYINQPGNLFGTLAEAELELLAEDAEKRRATGKVALRKLAHYATDAADYRHLAEVLGLDPQTLKEDA